jgi:hypothetical protein
MIVMTGLYYKTIIVTNLALARSINYNRRIIIYYNRIVIYIVGL